MDRNTLHKKINELVEKLPEKNREFLSSRLENTETVFPFNNYEYCLMYLLDNNIITFKEYDEIRNNYINYNKSKSDDFWKKSDYKKISNKEKDRKNNFNKNTNNYSYPNKKANTSEVNKNKELDYFGIIYYKNKEDKTKNYFGYINTEKLNKLYNLNIYADKLYVFCVNSKDEHKLNVYLKTTKNSNKIITYLLGKNVNINKLNNLFIGSIKKENADIIFTLNLRNKENKFKCKIEKYNDNSGKIII